MNISLGARHDFLRRHGVADGWRARKLGDLADVFGGGTPSRGDNRFWHGGTIPWATPTDITGNDGKFISATAECITEAGLKSSAAGLLPPGSILYTSRATIGAKAIASLSMATNQGFASFVPRSVRGDYLYYLLDLLTPVVKRLGAGTTFDEVSKREIKTVWCSLPADQDEQALIARILDAVDTAIERTRAAVAGARNLKQALLQRFFYAALGETAYADRPRKALPAKWQLLQTGTLLDGDPKNGVSPKASSQPPGIPTFSIAAVRDGRIDLAKPENLKYIQDGKKVSDVYRVRRGDILVVRGNANPDLVAKAGMISDFPDGCVYPDITKRVVFRSGGEGTVLPDFALLSWNHPIVHNQLLRRAKTSNGTLKVNSRDVRETVLPVPSLAEQRRLLALVAAVERQGNALCSVQRAQEGLKRSLMQDLLTGHVRVDLTKVGGEA